MAILAGSQRNQCGLNPSEPDSFLFQAQILAQTVVSQVIVQCAFLGVQARQVPKCLFLLPAPLGLEGQQRSSIHQQGLRMGQVGAQLIQDREAVGINVSPVIHLAAH